MLDSQCVKQAQLTCRLTIPSFSASTRKRHEGIRSSKTKVADGAAASMKPEERVTIIHEAAAAAAAAAAATRFIRVNE